MGTESEGFPDEPTFNLAALAGQELLQERIRELENLLADPVALLRTIARDTVGGNNAALADVVAQVADYLEQDIAGPEHPLPELALVDPEDLRRGVAFARGVGYPAPGIVDVLDRLSDAAGSAPSGHPTSPERAQGVLPGMTLRPAASEASQGDSARSGDDGP